MAINWTELKTDWKNAMDNPSTVNNTDAVVNNMVNALKKQLDKAKVTGVDSRGDALSDGKIT